MEKKLSIQEQVEIIQRTLSNPDFMDEDLLQTNGYKPYRNERPKELMKAPVASGEYDE